MLLSRTEKELADEVSILKVTIKDIQEEIEVSTRPFCRLHPKEYQGHNFCVACRQLWSTTTRRIMGRVDAE